MKLAIRILLLVLGLGLFAWLVARSDPREIWATLSVMGWAAPLILCPYFLVYVADTLGWRFAFGGADPKTRTFPRLFRIRWMGEAVNNIAPTVHIGGEAVKVYLLSKLGYPTTQAAASAVVGKTTQFLGQAIFLTLGAVASIQVLGAAGTLRWVMLGIISFISLIVATLFWLQRRGLFGSIFRGLERLGLRSATLDRHRVRLLEIDTQIVDFYAGERPWFRASLAAFTTGWLLDTLEIFFVAWLMDIELGWVQALSIEAFIGVAKGVGMISPGAIGIQEAGIVLLCRLAGAPDVFGVSYAVLRRGRELAYAAVGWGMLFIEESTIRGITERVVAGPSEDAS